MNTLSISSLQRIIAHCIYLSIACIIPSIAFSGDYRQGGVNTSYVMGAPLYPQAAVIDVPDITKVDNEPAIRLANEADESYINVWITLSPSLLSNAQQAEKYSDLWTGVPHLSYVQSIANANFSSNPEAFCLIDWSAQNYSNMVFQVFHSIHPDQANKTLLYKGTNNFYYVRSGDLTPGVQDYVWVEVYAQNGDWVASSAPIPMRP